MSSGDERTRVITSAGVTHSNLGTNYRAVDWERTQRAIYRVWQKYRYSYTEPVRQVHQRLVVVPPDLHHDQRLLRHQVDVVGAAGGVALEWELDQFGNRVCRVQVDHVPQEIEFVAQYEVERCAETDWRRPAFLSERWDLTDYLQPTALTTPDPTLQQVAAEIAARTAYPRQRAELAAAWAADAITYELGVTTWRTTAAEALALGRGVCQDYAHLLLTVLRQLGIPARYASGHLLGEGAPHAWVEAAYEDSDRPGTLQFVGYDPTHRRQTAANYITVAVGRDFADVSPTSGHFRGRATGHLTYAKRAEIVEVTYR